MNMGTAESAAYSMVAAGQLAAAQPVPAQVAGFQTQVPTTDGAGNQAAFYGAPAAASAAQPNEIRPVVEYMEQMGADFRRRFETSLDDLRLQDDATLVDPADDSPVGQLLRQLQMSQQHSRQLYQRMLDASLVELQFSYIAKQCEMAVRNVQTLYQQAG